MVREDVAGTGGRGKLERILIGTAPAFDEPAQVKSKPSQAAALRPLPPPTRPSALPPPQAAAAAARSTIGQPARMRTLHWTLQQREIFGTHYGRHGDAMLSE
jgi:hypothetical protein